jgi:plastocyanin
MPAAPRTLAAIGLVLAAAVLAPLAAASPTRAAEHSIAVTDGAFGPATLTIAVGDTVTWTNTDDSPHTVTAEGGAFDSGNLNEGLFFSFTFTEPGTYTYVCSYHDEMRATIVVEPASAGAAAPSTTNAAPSVAPTTDAAHTAGGHATRQPDTALPAPAEMAAWLAPLLIGLGLVAFAFGLFPMRPTPVARERRVAGWRR